MPLAAAAGRAGGRLPALCWGWAVNRLVVELLVRDGEVSRADAYELGGPAAAAALAAVRKAYKANKRFKSRSEADAVVVVGVRAVREPRS